MKSQNRSRLTSTEKETRLEVHVMQELWNPLCLKITRILGFVERDADDIYNAILF